MQGKKYFFGPVKDSPDSAHTNL